jgi:phage terminase large subunit
LTYKDNEALQPAIVASIEQRKSRKGWWQVYGEGQLGEVEGKIYKGWNIIEEVPHEARLERRGLDFGYTNDPTAIVDVYYYNGGYILDEVAFMKGLSNRQIADILLGGENKLVIADSAEPKSIDEIRDYGVNIRGAVKGQDSVTHGIQLIQDQRISITKRSVNIIKEYRNYLWMTDKNGRILNEPEHTFSHTMDAIRYALADLVKRGSIRDETEADRIAAIRAYINPRPVWQKEIGLKPDEYVELQQSINQYITSQPVNDSLL